MGSNMSVDRRKEYLLGAGSFGTVYKITQNNELFAVKIINIHSIEKDFPVQYHDAHQREIIPFIKSLSHPNVIKIIECKYDEPEMKIFMEYCPMNLSQCCQQYLDQITTEKIILQTASGLNYLHEMNVIHRDLKPDNILIKIENGAIVPKVTDFSFAKDLDQASRTTMFTIRGNVHWVAPELIDDYKEMHQNISIENISNENVSNKSIGYKRILDVFSFALVILYVCCIKNGKDIINNQTLGFEAKKGRNIMAMFEKEWRIPDLKDKYSPLLRDMLVADPNVRVSMADVFSRLQSMTATA